MQKLPRYFKPWRSASFHMASLLELAQHSFKNRMRKSLIDMIKECECEYIRATRSAEENDKELPVATPLPVYDFPVLFDQMLQQMACNRRHDLWSFVLNDDMGDSRNTLVRFCVSSCETPMSQNRCMKFIEYVERTCPQAACQILVRYAEALQIEMLDPCFELTNVHTLLWWDYKLGASLMMNKHHSDMHRYVRNEIDNNCLSSRRRPAPPKLTPDIFARLRVFVSYFGEAYLGYFPAHHDYAINTLVTTALCHGDLSGSDAVMQELLHYLIHAAPATLRITGRTRGRHNAFTAVVDRCNNADDPQHRWIVESVMQYARLDEDILGVISHTGTETLVQRARRQSNTLVLAYIASKFGDFS